MGQDPSTTVERWEKIQPVVSSPTNRSRTVSTWTSHRIQLPEKGRGRNAFSIQNENERKGKLVFGDEIKQPWHEESMAIVHAR